MKAAIFSSFGNLIRKRRLPMRWKKARDLLQGERHVNRIGEYYYIKYALSVVTVIAWIILVLGFIASLVWGITTGGIQGGLQIVIGMIASFLAWLLLLMSRELLKLLVDVKENTISTSEGVTKKSH
ncbi:MAG: hypothetical protein ACOC6R_00615 [Chloroflexota bacterium]